MNRREGESRARALLAWAIPTLLEPAAALLLGGVVLLWLGDYALFRYRLSHGTAMGAVQVNTYLAVPLKNGHQQFDYTGSEPQPCVHALFPQTQGTPCWYLQRHRDQRTTI